MRGVTVPVCAAARSARGGRGGRGGRGARKGRGEPPDWAKPPAQGRQRRRDDEQHEKRTGGGEREFVREKRASAAPREEREVRVRESLRAVSSARGTFDDACRGTTTLFDDARRVTPEEASVRARGTHVRSKRRGRDGYDSHGASVHA